MRLGRLFAVVLALLVLPPATAGAQEDGIIMDPDSPSSKEYEIPTERARREASGGSGGDDDGAPLFGEGVGDDSGEGVGGDSGGAAGGTSTSSGGSTTSESAAAASPEGDDSGREERGRDDRRREDRKREDRSRDDSEEDRQAAAATPTATPPPSQPASAVADGSSGVGTWLLIGGIVLALAAVASGAALALRRGDTPPRSAPEGQ